MVKINGNEIRKGNVIEHKNGLWIAVKTSHVKPGKGGAFAQVELKNIRTNSKLNERFRSADKVERVRLEQKDHQFLYKNDEDYIFMDNETFDQINVATTAIGNKKNFLISGANVDLLFDDQEVLDIRLPSHVILEVLNTEPGFKGNTATGANKPATLETGYVINVPLFIDEGDKLRIDTRTGEYVERSKD